MAGRVQVVPQISQETFDQVVRENIADFDMTVEEAVVSNHTCVHRFVFGICWLSNTLDHPH